MSPLTLCSIVACLQPPILDLDDSTAALLARVVNSNIGPNEVVYLLNHQSSLDIHRLIVQLNGSLLVLSNGQNEFTNINADLWYSPNTLNAFVLVLCEELWPCYELISDQITRHAFNPRRKVLMQLVKDIPGSASPEILKDVFQRFRKINLLNVVIRFGSANRLQSFTYHPYEESFLINLTDSGIR